MSSFSHDVKWSSAIFVSHVWPLIRDSRLVGAGELMTMEGRPDIELAKELDMRSGIDGWQLMASGGMRGLASRVQKGKNWRTFTVRMARDSGSKTEFQKRKEAISGGDGQIYPHLTVQAYVETEIGPVVGVGVCKTVDLVTLIESGQSEIRRTTNASFAVCYWDVLKHFGYQIDIFDQAPPMPVAAKPHQDQLELF